jgi:fatty acid amide hydrolase
MTLSPGTAGDITRLSAAELAGHIASGELSAQEVVEAYLSGITRVHRRLNALAVPLFEQARAAAAAADAARDRGEALGPLHGVPVTIKEMFDVEGTPTTAGSTGGAAQAAVSDSLVVRRLRRAGAIVLGKTNVPQFGMFAETDNPVYGRTNNPWAADRSPGGSSGGEAALIAAGGSPLGLGSDGGGSIRHPCHCCGIHGLKPTGGRLPLRGHWMVPNWRDQWVQPGPMARRVADLGLALSALAASGPDDADAGPAGAPLGDPSAVVIGGLRIATYTDDGYFPPAPAIRRAVREAAAALRERGARVEDFRPPDIAEVVRIYFGFFYADGLAAVRQCLGNGPCDWRVRRILLLAGLPTTLRPTVRRLLAWTGQRYAAQIVGFLRRRRLTDGEYARLADDEAAYRRRFLAALDAGPFDAIVCPPSGLPALRHGAFNGTAASSYTYLYNLLGLPAGVVAATRVRPGEESDRGRSWDPVVRTARAVEAGSAGLPVGVQVVARPWREDVVLAVMAALEDHFRRQPDYPAYPPV